MTGSIAQLVNGVALIAASVEPSSFAFVSARTDTPAPSLRSFIGARIVYGGYMTLVLWPTLDSPNVSPAMRWGFRVANLALQGEYLAPSSLISFDQLLIPLVRSQG